jgi:GR25 family glycosyltransferase involved in LPS biosynthesis
MKKYKNSIKQYYYIIFFVFIFFVFIFFALIFLEIYYFYKAKNKKQSFLVEKFKDNTMNLSKINGDKELFSGVETKENTNSIYFFILNLDKNKDRYENISKNLDYLNIKYQRIKAIDGKNMSHDLYASKILAPVHHLLNKNFKCNEKNQIWIYDGTIEKSFPSLHLDGHFGTKGLTLSNLRAFEESLKLDYDWYCILEDDAEMNNDIYNKIISFINDPKNINQVDIVLLDKRDNGWGGTAGMLYNKKIIKQLINDLHPLSNFSITIEDKYKHTGLWDWKLWTYIKNNNIRYINLPIIQSGIFGSTINI